MSNPPTVLYGKYKGRSADTLVDIDAHELRASIMFEHGGKVTRRRWLNWRHIRSWIGLWTAEEQLAVMPVPETTVCIGTTPIHEMSLRVRRAYISKLGQKEYSCTLTPEEAEALACLRELMGITQ